MLCTVKYFVQCEMLSAMCSVAMWLCSNTGNMEGEGQGGDTEGGES